MAAKAKRPGRPKKRIDRRQVERLARIHCTLPEMAAVLGCSQDTIERNFAESIKKGREEGRRSLRRMQFAAAQKGNVSMLIWLGKQLLGQRDRLEMSNEELNAAIERELARLAGTGATAAVGKPATDAEPAARQIH